MRRCVCKITKEDVWNNLDGVRYISVSEIKDKLEENNTELASVKCWVKSGKIKRIMKAFERDGLVEISGVSNVFSVKKVSENGRKVVF